MAAPSFSSFPERKKSTPLPSPPPVVIRDERGERMRREDDSSSSLHLKKRAKYREVSPERESRDRKERKDSRHDEKRAERRSRKDGSRDEKRERREDPSSSKHHRSTVPTVAVPPPSSSSATKDYYLDTRGDPDILHFGSRRGYRFIPSGRGRVLGLGEEWRLDGRDAGSGRGVGVGLVGDSTDETRRGTRLKLVKGPTVRIRPKLGQGTEIEKQSDYIPVQKAKNSGPQKEIALDRVDAFWEEEDQKHSTEKNKLESDDGLEEHEFDEDDDLEEEEMEEDRRRREIIGFERRVKEDPEDSNGWIEYAKFHLSSTSTMDSSSKPRVDKNGDIHIHSKKAQSEIALEILTKAIKTSPRNKLNPTIQLLFFQSAQDVWPSEKITAEWARVLKELTHSQKMGNEGELMDLWLGFIAWREGRGLGSSSRLDGTSGGVEDVVDVYVECMGIMRDARRAAGKGSSALEENLVYLLVRCCLLLKHAGYTERATAIMQGMLELTFFKPARLHRSLFKDDVSWEARLTLDLESFWDAEVARIGDINAVGWSSWDSDNEHVEESKPVTNPQRSDTLDPYVRWYQDESAIEEQDSLPARALDLSEDDEDPYRTILFSDISPFLFVIQSPDVKLQFAYAAVNMFGVPLVPPGVGSNSAFYTDPYLSWSLDTDPDRLWPSRTNDSMLMLESAQSSKIHITQRTFTCPLKAWASDQQTLCEDVRPWFASITQSSLPAGETRTIINILKQLQTVVLEPDFKTAYLAVESICSRKGATKAAKALIASDQRNLQLYASYARVLRQQGKSKEARQVYMTCIAGMPTSEATQEQDLRLLLVLEWAEMELFSGNPDNALKVVLLAASPLLSVDSGYLSSQPSATTILKFRQAVASATSGDLIWLRLKYLSKFCQEPFQETFDDLKFEIQTMTANSPEQEEISQFACQLAWIQATRSHLAPTYLREFLEDLIKWFPNNTLFLSMYLANESGSQVYGRLHRVIEDNITNHTDRSAISYLWAAWAEARLHRGDFWASSSAAQRVRNTLDKALESNSNARRSLALWKAYIEFEAVQGNTAAAKRICYRAIAEIGTAKMLYMLPFSPALRPHFTAKELEDWAELMIEKGIRVRLPHERYWQPEEKRDYLENDDGGDPMKDEDQVFDFLQERKTLMPY